MYAVSLFSWQLSVLNRNTSVATDQFSINHQTHTHTHTHTHIHTHTHKRKTDKFTNLTEKFCVFTVYKLYIEGITVPTMLQEKRISVVYLCPALVPP